MVFASVLASHPDSVPRFSRTWWYAVSPSLWDDREGGIHPFLCGSPDQDDHTFDRCCSSRVIIVARGGAILLTKKWGIRSTPREAPLETAHPPPDHIERPKGKGGSVVALIHRFRLSFCPSVSPPRLRHYGLAAFKRTNDVCAESVPQTDFFNAELAI